MSNIVPTDKESVFAGLDELTTLEANAIVRPNNPPPGIAGFVFDLVSENSVELNADITDHYVENNTAIQDHIALKPEIVTVRGLVGELVLTQDQIDDVSKQADALPINAELEPEYTPIQQDELDAEAEVQADTVQAATDNKSLDSYFQARSPLVGSKQAKAFNYFYELWKGRQLFTVDTPWGFFTDMAIVSIRALQDEKTRMVSDFTISFKKIRFAQQLTIQAGQIAGRAAQQSSNQTNNGVAGQEPVSETTNESILHAITK